jgi:hypothetical protein
MKLGKTKTQKSLLLKLVYGLSGESGFAIYAKAQLNYRDHVTINYRLY